MKLAAVMTLILMSISATAGEKIMKYNIQEEIKLSPNAKIIKVLSNPSFKLVGLGFKKDQRLEKHQTPTPAILIVQYGSVDFKMTGITYELKAGDYFEIPANVEHEVWGKEDSFLYLIK
jgi:quercetin dioxygenase-like cupin family protein